MFASSRCAKSWSPKSIGRVKAGGGGTDFGSIVVVVVLPCAGFDVVVFGGLVVEVVVVEPAAAMAVAGATRVAISPIVSATAPRRLACILSAVGI